MYLFSPSAFALVTLLLTACAFAATAGPVVESLQFRVEASMDSYASRGTCISYRVPDNSLVTGYFRVNNPNRGGIRVAVLVSEGGNQPFSQHDLNGESRFSFRSRGDSTADYEACVRAVPRTGASVPTGQYVDVELSFGWNFDLFDDATAKRVMLDPIQNDFYQLEAAIGRLNVELSDFVRHEELHRDVNESTMNRLRFVSILAVIVLVGLGLYQLFYLKRFFKTKKLI